MPEETKDLLRAALLELRASEEKFTLATEALEKSTVASERLASRYRLSRGAIALLVIVVLVLVYVVWYTVHEFHHDNSKIAAQQTTILRLENQSHDDLVCIGKYLDASATRTAKLNDARTLLDNAQAVLNDTQRKVFQDVKHLRQPGGIARFNRDLNSSIRAGNGYHRARMNYRLTQRLYPQPQAPKFACVQAHNKGLPTVRVTVHATATATVTARPTATVTVQAQGPLPGIVTVTRHEVSTRTVHSTTTITEPPGKGRRSR